MNLLKARSIDATEGNLLPKILLYAFPLILSTLIQQLFNAVDIMVLGNMADEVAVASVTATSSIVSLFVNSFVGLASGSRVVLARQIGAKDHERVRKTTDTSLILAVGIGIAVAAICFFASPWFLDLTNCPPECRDEALLYVRIYAMAAPFIMLYNFGSSAVTASGDTQRPLYYIIIGGAANVVLNVVLCLILPQKVIAVAIATAVSQIISAALISRRLIKMDGPCRVVIRKMRFCGKALGDILRFGLPMLLTNAIFPISNLQIQSAINSFGVAATAGNGAASTIESIISSTSAPFGTTVATFVGQNIGAQKPDRVKKSFYDVLIVTVLICGTISVAAFLTGEFWLGLIVGKENQTAITYGLIRMSCTTLFYVIAGVNNVYGGALQAHGYSTFSAINSIFCVLIFRTIWMQTVYVNCSGLEDNRRFFMVVVCFTVAWAIRMVANVVGFAFVRMKYNRGFRRVL